MLTADQIDALGDKAQKITEPIIEFLIQDIARRISEAGQLTSTASYQTWRLQQLGVSQRQLKKELRKRLKVSHRELRKLLTQAAEVGYNFDISKLPYYYTVERIGKSVGAKAKNYRVYNPGTGDFVQLAEGSRITQPKNHVMAGCGRERQIDCIDWLVDKYGGDAVKWTKEKGFGYVEDEYGDFRQVELHWYQEPSVGKVEMKIKYRDGRAYLDDE